MAAAGQEAMKKAFGLPLVSFDALAPGSDGPVSALVSRRWDVYNVNNKFMSTDFLFSDQEGTIMYAQAKDNAAHYFVDKLQEGSLYFLKGFVVVENPPKWRILKDSEYIIRLQGSTVVRKAPGPLDGYIRHPFQLVPLDALQPTGTTHFVDVIGSVGAVGSPVMRSNNKQTVDFKLSDDRGHQIRVTFWGRLGDQIILKKSQHGQTYNVILTSMTAKIWNVAMTLVSSTASLIVDNPTIPEIAAFTESTMGRNLESESREIVAPQQSAATLAELLDHGRRDQKQANAMFCGPVEITGVQTKNGWYNLSCSAPKCRKGVRIEDGVFRCASCNINVRFPRPRYRVQLVIKDESASITAVCFDEPAEQLLRRTVGTLIDEHDQDDSEAGSALPRLVRELIGTTHTLQIRALSYYHYGDYESFNCDRVIDPSTEPAIQNVSPSNSQGNTSVTGPSASDKPGDGLGVFTPAKPSESYARAEASVVAEHAKGKNKRPEGLQARRLSNTRVPDGFADPQSDKDPASPVDGVYDDGTIDLIDDFGTDDAEPAPKRVNRRLILSDSEGENSEQQPDTPAI